MNSNDYGEPVSPVRRAWENGGRQYYQERTGRTEREISMIDEDGQMDVCTPVRRRYATSPGYALREENYLVSTGQLDCGLQPPAGWREPQPAAPARSASPHGGAVVGSRTGAAEIKYAQYDPAFDPDLHPLSAERTAKRKSAKPVPAVLADDSGDELPPDMTPAQWLAQRHVVCVARKAVADPASVSYVPVAEEEPQLVVTPAGFRYTERFNHLEIRR